MPTGSRTGQNSPFWVLFWADHVERCGVHVCKSGLYVDMTDFKLWFVNQPARNQRATENLFPHIKTPDQETVLHLQDPSTRSRCRLGNPDLF